jgi:hypothetical protein
LVAAPNVLVPKTVQLFWLLNVVSPAVTRPVSAPPLLIVKLPPASLIARSAGEPASEKIDPVLLSVAVPLVAIEMTGFAVDPVPLIEAAVLITVEPVPALWSMKTPPPVELSRPMTKGNGTRPTSRRL